MSVAILPEEIGRLTMLDKVALAVTEAMSDAGIEDPADVHYVQTKTPLLTAERIQDAHRRGKTVALEDTMATGALVTVVCAPRS